MSTQRVTKAVIAVAGFGSRFFPVTKTINKCLLPVLNRPILHLAVQDCVQAGIDQIAIVTAPGDTQVRHYFSHDEALQREFREHGWDAKYAVIDGLERLAEFTFLEQPRDGRYGTALPAQIAHDFVAGDDFVLMSGDDVVLRADGGSDLADMIRHRDEAGAPAAIAAATKPGEQAYRYGVFITRQRDDGLLMLDHLEEKPADYTGPLAHINISRQILPGCFFDYLTELKPAASGEYQITDAIAAFLHDNEMLVHPLTGTYFDCGDVAGWLSANTAAAQIAGIKLDF